MKLKLVKQGNRAGPRSAPPPDDGSGDWYFLGNTPGGPLEGACWHTRANGAQEIGEVDLSDQI